MTSQRLSLGSIRQPRRVRSAIAHAASAVLLAGLPFTVVQAQSAAVEPGREAASSNQPAPAKPGAQPIETVVITAGKRRQSQRDIAGNVSAISGSALEADGANDQEDIFRLLPGVQLNKGDPNQALPTIRGVGTVTRSAALGLQQATTGVYIEDVPFTDPTAFIATADLAPFDLERVEVLRGPQGALFGSASLGGAVRYVLNKPDLKGTGFSLLTSVGTVSHGGLNAAAYAMANLPLNKDVAGLRVVAFDRHDAGYILNSGTGQDRANGLHQRGGRLLGTLQLGGGANVTGVLMTQTADVDDGFAVSPDPGRLEIKTPTASTRSSRFQLGNVQVEVPLGWASFSSSTAYVEKHSNGLTDLTRRAGDIGPLLKLPLLPVVVGSSLLNGHSASQEFRIVSPDNGALTYLAGVFYQRSSFDANSLWTAPGGALLWGAKALPNDTYLTEKDHINTTESAVFGDGEYRFGSGFSATLGGRWYRNKAHYDVDSRLLEPVLGGPVVVSNQTAETGFTPKLSVKYRFGDHLWYALASRGYRFGGINPANGTTYKSDSLWNYESGVKLTLGPRWKLDASAFYIDWKDAQVNARQTGTPPVNGIANIGKAKVTGVELGTQWQALESLGFSGSASYTDAQTGTPFTSNNRATVPSGTRLPGTAHWQSALQGSYRFTGPLQTAARLDLTHAFTGRRTTSIDNGGIAPAYAQLDARLAFALERWELGFFASNIADKRGVSGGAPVTSLGGTRYTDYYLIAPRTIGLTLRYDL